MLSRCLDGLLAQSAAAPAFEVVIGDDGCAYDLAAQVAAHPLLRRAPIAITRAETPGAAGARMAAVRRARGPLLGFLDDDAEPTPAWLEVLVGELARRGPLNAVTGQILPFQTSLLSRARQARYDERRRGALADPDQPVGFLAGGNFAIAAEAFRAAGGFDERFAMMHDGEFQLRLRKLGGACFYADDLIIRHTHVKTRFEAYVNAFRSGRYRHALSQRYPELSVKLSRELGLVLRGLVGRRSADPLAIQAVNSLLQLVHVVGLIKSRLADRALPEPVSR